jgi:enoyl-CoA hydratase/carnithine racemase
MPEVKLGIPSVVEAALLPRLMGSGRAAWLVLTGEPIDAERAYHWGFVEALADEATLDQTVSSVVDSLMAGDRSALAMQKELLHLWQAQPLRASIDASIERFAHSYASGLPNERMRRDRR